MSKMKYFLFNKVLDYKRGYLNNLSLDGNQVVVSDSSDNSRCVFISRVMDSQENDTEWHRLVFHMDNEYGIPYKVYIYSANNQLVEYNDELYNIHDIIKSKDISLDVRFEMMQGMLKKEMESSNDFLLHDITGRYLWIAIEIYRQSEQKTSFKDIKITFPRTSWISYMPEVYQSNDKDGFLERYLGIFQSFYEDMNDEIAKVPYIFDVSSTKKEFLMWMSNWLDLSESYMWSEEQLRRLLSNAIYLFKIRGTKKSVSEFIKLYTNEEPCIVEYYQIDRYKNNSSSNMKKLLCDNPYKFSVLVKDTVVKTPREYSTLLKIIEEVKPAHMEVNLIVVKPYIFLGGHSYLGINSSLGYYRPFSLDGFSTLPFAKISDNIDVYEREEINIEEL